MAGNLTSENTDISSVQVDDKPPVYVPPYAERVPSQTGAGLDSRWEGANQTGLGSLGFLSDIDSIGARGGNVQWELAGKAQEAREHQNWADKQFQDNSAEDTRRQEDAWKRERASADDPAMRPWNADQERANRIRGPMEQFGSLGFIFAMAASRFTRTPMTSALNAGAAAMTAIQQGDEKAYQSAYKAWQDNSNLALKRFDMEHRLYEDANQLLTTDMSLWKTKTLMIASQFDDQKKIIMLNNGMDADVLKAQDAAAKAAIDVRKAQQGFEEYNTKKDLFTGQIEAWKNDPEHPERKKINDKNPTPEYVQMKLQAWHNVMDPAYRTSRQTGILTENRERAADIDQEIRDKQAKGELKTPKEVADYRAKRSGELKTASAGLTGNKQVDLQERINKFTHSSEVIDRITHELETHFGSAGLAGKALRLEERLSNMVSAGAIKDSDRVQMMRDVELLRLWGKELLTSKNDRLKASGERIDSIIAGISTGDTTANTLRSLKELKKLYATMKSETEQELGKPTSTSTSTSPAKTESGKKPSYLDAPIMGH